MASRCRPANRPQFPSRKDEARGHLSPIAQQIARLLTTIVLEAAVLPKKLAPARAVTAPVRDIDQQLARLFPRRFVEETPAAQLAHYPRYRKAIGRRCGN
jgi:ATP-dependent helicase HrpA